ncbi:MAG: glycosyltransferase [Polyangiales bacterium]
MQGPVLPRASRAPAFAIVAPYLPAPTNTGGRIRIHRLARALARRGPVDLYARYWPVEMASSAGDVSAALSIYREKKLCDRGPFMGIPFISSSRAREAAPRALRDALRARHREAPYAAVIACHAYASLVAMSLDGVALVLDEHNIESRYARTITPDARLEALRLARLERRVWRVADLVTVVTDDDAREVSARRDGPVAVIANGVACGEIRFIAPSSRASREILFVGAMGHPPNVRCAVALAREVLPRVRETYPDARVVLCGRAPAREVEALAGPHVEVTGTVDSVAPWLDRAGAYVNLLDAGAGSSLKVPEALAAGVPLISTRVGVRGFALRERTHHLGAETPDEAAHAVVAAWRDTAASDARAMAAREVAAALDWDALGDRFASLVLAAAEKKGTT